MTAPDRIRKEILLNAQQHSPDHYIFDALKTAEQVQEAWEKYEDDLQDDISEFREGEYRTELSCESSRHYESESVARQLSDGSWVGWTYWYGGGKHGCPEEIDWLGDAYDLDVTEEEKLVVVRTFKKKGE